MSRLRLQLVAAVLFALAWTQSARVDRRAESGILPIDPPTPFIRFAPDGPPKGRALFVHGLNSSKENTSLICAALADGGFEVWAIDLPGHGDSRTPFQTERAEQAIRNAKASLGGDVIVLGHSMGAALLLDMAENEHFSTMVLLAPAPVPISVIKADRVLVATGDIDVPRIRSFMPIVADLGHPRSESWLLPWAAHSSPIFSPAPVRRVVEWLDGDAGRIRTIPRTGWLVLMLLAAALFGVATLRPQPLTRIDAAFSGLCARYVIAFTVALFALKLIHPFRWLRVFASDYLVGFLFIAGLVLVGVSWERGAVGGRRSSISIGLLAAAFVIAVPGLLVASQLAHLSIVAGGRWWRFPFMALASLPLFLADELMIRRLRSRFKSDAGAVLIKALLFVSILTGVLTLNRESAFLVLIVPVIFIFWIALWFATGVVHRHTQSPAAAAVFAAIVQGWVFAAFFVTI